MVSGSRLGRLSESGYDFIDEAYLHSLLQGSVERSQVEEVLAKSLNKQPLTPEETAILLKADQPELLEQIFDTARKLKRQVYGNRIVLFAPLYIGNLCVNDCQYCGFRRSNPHQRRRTLSPNEIQAEVRALENQGHKRLILVFGDHTWYSADFIAECVRLVYATRSGRGEIRRVNINAAPLDHDGFAAVKSAG
ncbi:MAG: radical SAM protein, partial [Thermoguttaceae bacterium]|nr:radical SAM protein [Thermoguttaceae bacterium]